MEVKIENTALELQNGTMFRYLDEPPEYMDVGIDSNGNKVLFYYPDATETVDYVGTIIDNIPDFAAHYLDSILNSNKNLLVRCWYVAESESSCYEIYYNCDCYGSELEDLINWMEIHNDWAAKEYRFTYIVNGKQKCIGD